MGYEMSDTGQKVYLQGIAVDVCPVQVNDSAWSRRIYFESIDHGILTSVEL